MVPRVESTYVAVRGNRIGTDVSGTATLPNAGGGLVFTGVAGIVVGANDDTGTTTKIKVNWYDATGAFIRSSTETSEFVLKRRWERVATTDSSPDGAAYAALEITIQSATTARSTTSTTPTSTPKPTPRCSATTPTTTKTASLTADVAKA